MANNYLDAWEALRASAHIARRDYTKALDLAIGSVPGSALHQARLSHAQKLIETANMLELAASNYAIAQAIEDHGRRE